MTMHRPLSPTEIEAMTLPELRTAITDQAQFRGPAWRDSILRPLRRQSIADLNMAACRVIARMWCLDPPRPGVVQTEPGSMRGGIWQ